MTLTVFIPVEVADRCYLFEALLWISVQRFPLASLVDDGGDARESNDLIDALEPALSFEEPFTQTECSRLSLPPDPRWALLESDEYFFEPEILRTALEPLIATGNVSEDDAKIRIDSVERLYALKKDWDLQFIDAIDEAKARLFIAFREGLIRALGKKLPRATYTETIDTLEAAEWDDLEESEWIEIPREFWLSHKINWDSCRAESNGSAYALILVNFEELFKQFPPTPEVVEGIVKYGDVLASLSKDHRPLLPKSKRGRPSLNWEAFHVEVARCFQNRDIPSKQEAFIAQMQEWCRINWNRDVGRSTILSKVKPYYDEIIRKSENTDH